MWIYLLPSALGIAATPLVPTPYLGAFGFIVLGALTAIALLDNALLRGELHAARGDQ